jgi:hypothetical protein
MVTKNNKDDHSSRKTLIVFHGTATTRGDQKALLQGLRRIPGRVDSVELKDLDGNVSKWPIGDYDSIILPWFGSALYASFGHVKDTLTYIFNNAKPYAICLPYDELTFTIDTHVWNKDDLKSRASVYDMRPVKVIGAFDRSVLNDKESMGYINKKFMKHLHKDSVFTTCPWLSFFSYFLPDEMAGIGEEYPGRQTIFDSSQPTVNRFYYGANKPVLKESLQRMHLGESPEDGVFGNIKKVFPNVRDFSTDVKKNNWSDPNSWAWFARNAAELLVPYEPIKGEYLLTKRYYESLTLSPDNSTFDDRINTDLIDRVKNGTEYADTVLDDFSKILDE